jgi:hypothetical protein
MSMLDELFSDLQEDLQKAEEEESAVDNLLSDLPKPPTPPPISTSANTSNHGQQVSKKPKLMPTQLIKKKEVVTSAAPTLNKEYLQDMFGLAEDNRAPPMRKSSPQPHIPSAPRTFVGSSISSTSVPSNRSIASIAPPPPPQPYHREKQNLVFEPPASSNTAETSKPDSFANEHKAGSNDIYKLFVGNLGMEARDDALQKVFKDYPSVTAVQVLMEPGNKEKCRGYGFVTFTDPFEMLRAMREKNGKLCGARPMQIARYKPTPQSLEVQNTGDKGKKKDKHGR